MLQGSSLFDSRPVGGGKLTGPTRKLTTADKAIQHRLILFTGFYFYARSEYFGPF
jgi:hypothetical protein